MIYTAQLEEPAPVKPSEAEKDNGQLHCPVDSRDERLKALISRHLFAISSCWLDAAIPD